jgi:Organic solute transporter Ostalpha
MRDPETFLFVRQGVLQFIIIKPLLAILVLILKVCGKYEEGYIAWDSSYLWMSLAYNTSVCWSMYCLVMFYIQCARDLKPHRPVPKFICVKAIVFLTFW